MRFMNHIQQPNAKNPSHFNQYMLNPDHHQQLMHNILLDLTSASSSSSFEIQCQAQDDLENSCNGDSLSQTSQSSQTHSKETKKRKDYVIKKKTELCKTFQLGLECPYGNKCSFAHGINELKVKLMVPINYKTVKCKQYHQEMYCHYGPRCQFVHKTFKSQYSQQQQKTRLSYASVLEYISMSLAKEIYDNEASRIHKDLSTLLNEKTNLLNLGLDKLDAFKALRKSSNDYDDNDDNNSNSNDDIF